MKRFLGVLWLAGCASGGSSIGQDAQGQQADAKVDAANQPGDARIDTPPPVDAVSIDTPPPIDAPPDACVPVATQLLVNPVFDLTPTGTGWQSTVIDPAYPLITDQAGVAPHSVPYRAWLGGFDTGGTDVLYQDVVVPAGTTSLVLTGVYEVRTGETSSTIAYDTASIALTQPNGTPIVTVNSFSNLTATTTWTAINFTVPQNLSGQTVRLRMTSTGDSSNASSFYFDTLALTATHCP